MSHVIESDFTRIEYERVLDEIHSMSSSTVELKGYLMDALSYEYTISRDELIDIHRVYIRQFTRAQEYRETIEIWRVRSSHATMKHEFNESIRKLKSLLAMTSEVLGLITKHHQSVLDYLAA